MATSTRLFPGQAIGVGVSSDLKEGLNRFAEKVQKKAARSATFAMADALHKEMQINARKGQYATGSLAEAIYTYYDESKSANGKHVYAVGVNKREAGNWHWIEYGRWRHYQTIKINGEWITLRNRPLENPVWVPPTPYLRPAFDAKVGSLFSIYKTRFTQALRES